MSDVRGKVYFRAVILIVLLTLFHGLPSLLHADVLSAPAPLLEKGSPVEWWFIFKFNAASFPGCGDAANQDCSFGGVLQKYDSFSRQFVFASSKDPGLRKGGGCLGAALNDPLGATFDQVYNGSYYYVLWNDQFHGDPLIPGCRDSCDSPWGRSKGMLVWNGAGEGFVMQVTTPSWPSSGSAGQSRTADGNTLGCIHDNNIKASQHFFATKLTKRDTLIVLKALNNASVATDPRNGKLVHNGGPEDIRALVNSLGKKSGSFDYMKETLSNGVVLISKPSLSNVPPWQMVSSLLGKVSLKTATWWADPKISTTTIISRIGCWDDGLSVPGAVQIALSGRWSNTTFSLHGGPGTNVNNAKIGVSTERGKPYTIFGDLNQQGALYENCASGDNGRGGIFYVVNNEILFNNVSDLIGGNTSPAE